MVACARRPPTPPPAAPAPPPLAEEPLAPTTSAEFQIPTPTQTVSADGKDLFVRGTVRNVGSRASREVRLWVDGLDANGNTVARAEALPTPQTIPPGGAATFVTRLPNDPAIRLFHVEAVGK